MGKLRTAIPRLAEAGMWAALAIAAGGTLLAVTVRDWCVPLAVLYYATPWLLRLLAGAAIALWWRRQEKRKWAGVAIMLVAAWQGWDSLETGGRKPAAVPGAVEISVWNTGRVLADRPDLWPAAAMGDVCAIVETGRFRDEEWDLLKARLPGQQWLQLGQGMALGVKGRILGSRALHEAGNPFRAFCVQVELPGKGEVRIIVVDIYSQPWFDRRPTLAKILEAAGGDRHCVILGDFNTPAESRWLDGWRSAGMSLANDAPRTGFRETWAWGAPLLTLDQIWAGPGWQALSAQKIRYGSDHARVMVRLAWQE